MNSNDSISRGDYNNKTGSMECMSSKSQKTIKDLWDFNYEITLSSNIIFSTKDSATIYFDLIAWLDGWNYMHCILLPLQFK